MDWTKEQIEIGLKFDLAIERGDIGLCRSLCQQFPYLITDHTWQVITGYRPTWIKVPARAGNIAMMETLLELGFDVNALSGKEQSSALGSAVSKNHYEMAEFLLRKGANPNLDRPLISALNREPGDVRMAFVRLLVENGCDVNQLYDLYGDSTKQFTALDWTKDPEIVAYLKSKGAKKAAELKGEAIEPAVPTNVLEEVIEYFQNNFGEVDNRSMIEIVPSGFPVAIHSIRLLKIVSTLRFSRLVYLRSE